MLGAFENMNRSTADVVHATEIGSVADRPINGHGADAERLLDFVKNFDRVLSSGDRSLFTNVKIGVLRCRRLRRA